MKKRLSTGQVMLYTREVHVLCVRVIKRHVITPDLRLRRFAGDGYAQLRRTADSRSGESRAYPIRVTAIFGWPKQLLRLTTRRSMPAVARLGLARQFQVAQHGREALPDGPSHGACIAADWKFNVGYRPATIQFP